MAYAYTHIKLIDGDLKYMGKLAATHVSGNLEMLDFEITDKTEIVYHKDTTRKGKRLFHEYSLSLNNSESGKSLTIKMADKPSKNVIYGSMSGSLGT